VHLIVEQFTRTTGVELPIVDANSLRLYSTHVTRIGEETTACNCLTGRSEGRRLSEEQDLDVSSSAVGWEPATYCFIYGSGPRVPRFSGNFLTLCTVVGVSRMASD
jgi:hypothetical protein